MGLGRHRGVWDGCRARGGCVGGAGVGILLVGGGVPSMVVDLQMVVMAVPVVRCKETGVTIDEYRGRKPGMRNAGRIRMGRGGLRGGE